MNFRGEIFFEKLKIIVTEMTKNVTRSRESGEIEK